MSVVSINLSKLETAATAASEAAENMEEYASLIPGKITSPMGSLTGGSSSNTSAVVSLAQQKASELKKRAAEYDALSSQLSSFVTSAREADDQVKSRISAVTESYVDDMSWWQKICYTVERLKNKVFNMSGIGKLLGNLSNMYNLIDDWLANKTKKIFDWFKRGDGKYWLSIVFSGAAAIAAIVTAIMSFPVSGIFAAIMAGCAVISAVVSTLTFVFTFMDGLKAITTNNTEPGVADYYGSTDSVEDYANKHTHSATIQSIAGGIDLVGKIASLATSIGNNFVKTAADGTKLGTLNLDDIKKNVLGNFGITYDPSSTTSNGYSLDLFGKKSVLGLSTDKSKWYTEGTESITWVHNTETVKNFNTVIKNITSGIKNGTTIAGYAYGGIDSASDVKSLVDSGVEIIGSYLPNVSKMYNTSGTMISGIDLSAADTQVVGPGAVISKESLTLP